MAGAYYFADFGNCRVVTTLTPFVGAAMWCPDCPSSQTFYEMWRWNDLFPGYAVPIPAFCPRNPSLPPQPGKPTGQPTGQPGSSTPPVPVPTPPAQGDTGPITGDPPGPPPVEDGCEPTPSLPPDDHATSSSWLIHGGKIQGQGGGFGDGPIDFMAQPRIGGLTPLAVYTADGTPTYTNEPEVEFHEQESGGHRIDSLHDGTGPGILCVHPPELQDYMLHGSGVNQHSRWPTELSDVTLLLHNCTRADATTGDSSVTRLAFGNPLKGSVKPKSGIYFTWNPSTRELAAQVTDANGTDENAGSFTFNGNSWSTAGGDVTANGSDGGDFPAAGFLIQSDGNNKVIADSSIQSSNVVQAGANIADHRLVRGDGGARGVQETGITVDDSNNVSGLESLDTRSVTISKAAAASITEASTAALDLTGALAGSEVRRRWIPFRVSITTATDLVTWAIASGANYRFRLKCLVKRTDSGNQSAWVDYGWVVQDIGGTVTVTAEANNSIDGALAVTAPSASSSKGASPLLISLNPTAGTEVYNGVLEVEGPLVS